MVVKKNMQLTYAGIEQTFKLLRSACAICQCHNFEISEFHNKWCRSTRQIKENSIHQQYQMGMDKWLWVKCVHIYIRYILASGTTCYATVFYQHFFSFSLALKSTFYFLASKCLNKLIQIKIQSIVEMYNFYFKSDNPSTQFIFYFFFMYTTFFSLNVLLNLCHRIIFNCIL